MPLAPLRSGQPVRDRPRRAGSTRVRLLLPLVVVAALASCGGDDDAPTAYGAGTETEFMELCAPTGSGDSSTTSVNDASSTVATCQCAYESIVEQVPFERYVDELRDDLRDGPSSWPDEITELMTDCVLAGIDLDATSTTVGG
jgi:hypothetical protein